MKRSRKMTEGELYEWMEAQFVDFLMTNFIIKHQTEKYNCSIGIAVNIENKCVDLLLQIEDDIIGIITSIEFDEIRKESIEHNCLFAICIFITATDKLFGSCDLNPYRNQYNKRGVDIELAKKIKDAVKEYA